MKTTQQFLNYCILTVYHIIIPNSSLFPITCTAISFFYRLYFSFNHSAVKLTIINHVTDLSPELTTMHAHLKNVT